MLLSELVNEIRDKVLVTSERLTALMAELERSNEKIAEMKRLARIIVLLIALLFQI